MGVLRNLTLTTALSGQDAFIRAADLAWLQISTGAFDYKSAIKAAIQTVAAQGLEVIHFSGRRDRLDVAMRRTVLTGVNQTVGQLQMTLADTMGQDLVQVSAHVGARNTGEGPANHESWQGKVYSRTGKGYPDFVSTTGYGTGEGLLGWNCRHSFYPFFEGLSQNPYTQAMLEDIFARTVVYNGKTMTVYEATQLQRKIERGIRAEKRQAAALEAAGLEHGEQDRSIRGMQATMRDFLSQTGLGRQREREQNFGISKLADQPAYLKTYPGVNIELGGNAVIEKTVESALDVVQKQGYDIPPTIKIDYDFFVKGGMEDESPCAYMKNVIYINDRHEIWNDPIGYMKTNCEEKIFSTDRPEAVVWHEIGHYLLAKADPAVYYQLIIGAFADATEVEIARQVSEYATENPVEFVAEVFAARLAGITQKFNVDVFLLFQKYGGGI